MANAEANAERPSRRRREVAVPETITVRLTPVMGTVKTIVVPKDSTVAEALRAGGYPESVEVRCNGEGVLDKDMLLEDNDNLTIITEGKVENGR